MAKVKISREFIFKAYVLDSQAEVSNSEHSGEFFYKSECHYYCEKAVLDIIKNNPEPSTEAHKYAIYKVSTKEDSKIADILVELITYAEGKINIC